jgi:hypothetical protein
MASTTARRSSRTRSAGVSSRTRRGTGRRPQLEFIEATTKVVAAFAANQFGKSTVLTICSLRECLPRDAPGPAQADEAVRAPCRGGCCARPRTRSSTVSSRRSRSGARSRRSRAGRGGRRSTGARMELRSFANGSTIDVQDVQAGPVDAGRRATAFRGYDEPPPKKHREEGRMRTVRYGGYEMFAMTPLDTNTAYVSARSGSSVSTRTSRSSAGRSTTTRRWTRRRSRRARGPVGHLASRPRVRGVRGCRRADLPGFRAVRRRGAVDPASRSWDVVVGDRPWYPERGHRVRRLRRREHRARVRCAAVAGLDAEGLRVRRSAGPVPVGPVRRGRVSFVADPAARQRGQTNAETVMSRSRRRGLLQPGPERCAGGDRAAPDEDGAPPVLVSPERSPGLLGLRDEADEYAAKEPEEGKDDSIWRSSSRNDHRLDALRYA